MSTGGGARALGMGGAYVALANDASSVYWNASALSGLTYPQFLFMYSSRFAGLVKYNFAAVAIPYGKTAGIGIGIIRLGVDDIPKTVLTNPDLELGEIYVDEEGKTRINRPQVAYRFSDAEYGFFLSFGKRKSNRLTLGGAVKVVHKTFDGNSAWGLGFDFSARYIAGSHIVLGANFQDLTTTLLAWNTGRKEVIVPTLKLGGAFPFEVRMLKGYVVPALDLDLRFENRGQAAQFSLGGTSIDSHAGVEFRYNRRIALRLGSDTGSFTAGAGLRIPRLSIDYAFMSHNELGDTHRISVLLTLEEKRFRRR